MIEPAYISEHRVAQEKAKEEAKKLRKGKTWQASDKLIEIRDKHNAKNQDYAYRANRLRGAPFAAAKAVVSFYCNAWMNGRLHQGKYLETSNAAIGEYISQSARNVGRHIQRFQQWGIVVRKYSREQAKERFGITLYNNNYLLQLAPALVRSMIGDNSQKLQDDKATQIKKMQALASRGDHEALNAFVNQLFAQEDEAQKTNERPMGP